MAWAGALVMFKPSGVHVPPLALNLFKNTIGLVLLVLTIAVRGDLAAVIDFSASDIMVLAISGILGIGIADTLFFHSLNRLGVGLVAIIECLYSPFVLLFAWLVSNEQLTLSHGAGAALILVGIGVATRGGDRKTLPSSGVVLGFTLGAVSMAFMTFGIVWAKPVLNDFDLIWATTIRLAAGTVCLAVYGLFIKERRALFAVFKPAPIWRISVPSSILASYVCMILWVAGFKYTKASEAGILNQTSTIFALILATFVLREPFTKKKLVAVSLALAGVVLTLSPTL
jgi:drug/metabolite transporter (DMT)-like permease